MRLLNTKEMEMIGVRLKELKKDLPRITYPEYIEMVKDVSPDKPYLVNIRGANGTGKSTIPLLMTITDPDTVLVVNEDDKEILTYCPAFETTLMGRYYTKTGGLDISLFQDKYYIQEILTKVWHDTKTNIIMEGIVVSSSYGFYADMFKAFMETDYQRTDGCRREVLIMNLKMDLDDLEKRIMARNGGKQIKMHYVKGKQDTVMRNVPKFERDKFNSWVTSNRDVLYSDMLDWFDKEISDHLS